MTPAEVVEILRQFNEYQRGDAPLDYSPPYSLIAAIDAAVELIERAAKTKTALRNHHRNAMCEGCDSSHPLTQLRLAAYQQSKLYADTVAALEE